MTLAAARAARSKGRKPQELIYIEHFRQLGALPNAGGLRDQRAGEVERMLHAEQVFYIMRSWYAREAGREDEWIAAHPNEWQLVKQVEQLERRSNG